MIIQYTNQQCTELLQCRTTKRLYYIDSQTNQIKILKDDSKNIYKDFIFETMNDAVRYKKTVYKTEFDDLGHPPTEDLRIPNLYTQQKIIKNKENRFNQLTSQLGDLTFFETDIWKTLEKINKEWLDNTYSYKIKKFLYKERLADWLTRKLNKKFTAASVDVEMSIVGKTIIDFNKLSGYDSFVNEITKTIDDYNKRDKQIIQKYKIYLSEHLTKRQETLIHLYSDLRKDKIQERNLRLSILSDCVDYKDLEETTLSELVNLDNIVYNDFYKSYNICIKNGDRIYSVAYIELVGDRYIMTDEKGNIHPNNSKIYIDKKLSGKRFTFDNSKHINLFTSDDSIRVNKKRP